MSHFSNIEFKISSKYKTTVINALKSYFGDGVEIYDTAKTVTSQFGASYAEKDAKIPVNAYVPNDVLGLKLNRHFLNGLGFNFEDSTMRIMADEYEIGRKLPELKKAISEAVVKQVAIDKGFNITGNITNPDGSITMNLKKKQIQTVL